MIESTMPHNLNSLINVTRYVSGFCLFITVLVALGMFVDRGLICLKKYQSKETMTREQVRSTSDGETDPNLPFIDFIVCPHYDVAYKTDMIEMYGLTKNNYRRNGVYMPTKSYNSSKGLRSVFNDVTYEVHEILKQIRMSTSDLENDWIVETLNNSSKYLNNIIILTKYQRNLGRCYSIRPKQNVIKLGILSIDFVAQIPFYVYLGYPGQFNYNTKTKVSSRLGQRVYLDFTHTLSINKLDTLGGHQCDQNLNLNYDDVVYQLIGEKNDEMFGCSVPWHPDMYSLKRRTEVKICNQSDLGLDATKQYDKYVDGIITKNLVPCAWFDIFPGLTDVDDTDNNIDDAYVRLYLKAKIKVKSVILHYDSTTFAAEIGGYVGVLLGVSIVDIAILSRSTFLKIARKFFKSNRHDANVNCK